jgi:hypothetical protein
MFNTGPMPPLIRYEARFGGGNGHLGEQNQVALFLGLMGD